MHKHQLHCLFCFPLCLANVLLKHLKVSNVTLFKGSSLVTNTKLASHSLKVTFSLHVKLKILAIFLKTFLYWINSFVFLNRPCWIEGNLLPTISKYHSRIKSWGVLSRADAKGRGASVALHSVAPVCLAENPENAKKEDHVVLPLMSSASDSHSHGCRGPALEFTHLLNLKNKTKHSEHRFVRSLAALDDHLEGAHIPLRTRGMTAGRLLTARSLLIKR